MDGDGYTLTWEQVRMGSTLLDRWAVRVTLPHLSVEFASVGWAELRGLWLVRFMPRDPGVENPTTYATYASREKAQRHIERWAAHHWCVVPVWDHPQHWGDR